MINMEQDDDIFSLVDTTSRECLDENLQALNIHISDSELKLLNETFPENAIAGTRYAEQQMGMVVN